MSTVRMDTVWPIGKPVIQSSQYSNIDIKMFTILLKQEF